MIKVSRENVCYEMAGGNKMVLEAEAGESLCFETKDCYSNNIQKASDEFTKDMWNTVNPATGPVFIKGASAGDVLRIEIEKINICDQVAMCVENGFGALGEFIKGKETAIYKIEDGNVLISDELSVPIRPMVGVIGTLPDDESVPNSTPGEHGGNMDCREITEGAVLYLPVFVAGGGLAMGDIHAVMGDGEVCICAAEVAGEVVVRAKAIKSHLPTPSVDTGENIVFIGSASTLDGCEKIVLAKAFDFLVNCMNFGDNEAARIMSLVGQLRVCQVVNPLKTMKLMLPKWIFAERTNNDIF